MRPINSYDNILVYNPAFLGDAVLTTPLLRALRRIYPEARITFCVRPEHEGLFRGLDILDDVISYDKRDTARGVSGIFQFSSTVKSADFDLVIDLHKSLRSSLVFALARKPFIIGFSSAVLSSVFDKRVHRDLALNEPERNLAILSALCSDFTMEEAKRLGGGLAVHVDKDILASAKTYIKSVTGDKKVVGIAPGSVWQTKKWPAERFAAAARILYDKGFAIALFGGRQDEDALKKFSAAFEYPYYDFGEKTKIYELPAFLAAADALLVNDSGAMHVAVAAGTPCVAIFGPTVRSLGFFPYDESSVVVENSELSCRPCGKHGGERCPKGHFKCMLDISPERVASEAEILLTAAVRK